HRLLAAARRGDDVRVVRDARRRGARDAVHPVPRAWPLARRRGARSRRDLSARVRVVRLHRLPARDREARESPDPPARAGEGGGVIARIWRGAVRREDSDEYVEYLRATGLPEYRATSGNRGAWILRRDLGERAVFYPEDDRFLVERDLTVAHYELLE